VVAVPLDIVRAPDDGRSRVKEDKEDEQVEEGESKQEGPAQGIQVWLY
jgi:hypothetical protein